MLFKGSQAAFPTNEPGFSFSFAACFFTRDIESAVGGFETPVKQSETSDKFLVHCVQKRALPSVLEGNAIRIGGVFLAAVLDFDLSRTNGLRE